MRFVICLLIILLFYSSYSQEDTITWQFRDSLPSTERIAYGSFLIDSNFYIVGGSTGSGFPWFGDVWKYSIALNQWQQMRNFPGGPITTEAYFVLNGNGYICSGTDSVSGYSRDNEFWEYYPAVDTWQHKANFPGISREAPVSFTHSNKAYVGLGLGPDDLWQYDPIADQWTQLSAPLCGSRTQCGVAVIDSFAYIIAGFGVTEYKDVWKYDINHDHWDSIGEMPGLLRGNPIFWNFGSFLIGGYGVLQDSLGNYILGSDVYRYDIKNNSWDSVRCLNFVDSTAGGAEGAFVIDTTGYFFGGYKTINPNFSYYKSMWSFDASKLFPPDTTTVGIQSASDNSYGFKLYPNPLNADQSFQIVTSTAGQISFYNSLWQVLYTTAFQSGINAFKSSQLNCNNELVFYKAQLDSGPTVTGKLVIEQ